MRRLRYQVSLFGILLDDTSLSVHECRFGERAVLGPREIFSKPHKWTEAKVIDGDDLKHSAVSIANLIRSRTGYRLALPITSSERHESLDLFVQHFRVPNQMAKARIMDTDVIQTGDDSILTAMAKAYYTMVPSLFGVEDLEDRLRLSWS